MRKLLPLTAALVLSVLLAVPAAAGGWATVTLDKVPTELRAGTRHTLGYTILQHGVTPFSGSKSVVRARSASGQTVTFAARAEGAPGHYVVDVTFPTAGAWTWEVVPEPFAPQPIGTITVTDAGAAASVPSAAAGVVALPTLILRVALTVAALCAALAFALSVRAARRPAPAAQ